MTRLAIEKSTITLVALFVVMVGGISAYNSLPRAQDPGFIIRTAVVQTVFPGASPERVELLVTDKIEKVAQEMPELESVVSTSKTGLSVVYVNILESETDMRPIWDDLRRKVSRIAGDLPADIIGPIVNDEFGDVFGSVITLTGEGFDYAELKEIADEARDEFLLIDEVAKVEIFGEQDERVFVEYSNSRLAELGLSPFQLQQALSNLNIIIPGGQITSGRERIALEPSGNFQSVEEIRRSVISLPGQSGLLFLEDIADVERGRVDPPVSLARANGQPALVLALSMREGGNIIDLGKEVETTLQRIQNAYPWGVEFEITLFEPEVVETSVSAFVSNLLQAIAIVLLVMLVSLGLRTGVVVASLVPAAMILSLLVMSALGIGLDQMSLAALIIALGMLVDNAIVMSESIMVQMGEGKKAIDAAVDSARELKIPLLISSLTTAAAFSPIALAESVVGEYTAPIFYVVTIALLSSWVLSLTVIPLLCTKSLRAPSKPRKETFDGRFYRGYRALLLAALRRPLLTVAGVIVVFFAALQLLGLVPNIFFPSRDVTFFTAELRFPTGTDIRYTESAVTDIEGFLERDLRAGGENEPGIQRWVSYVGDGGPRYILSHSPEPPESGYAFMVFTATNRRDFDFVAPALEAYAIEHYPDLRVTMREIENGPPVTNPVEVRISGRETDRIYELVDRVKTRLREIPGTKDIDDDWGPRTKKLAVEIDQPRAQRAGVSSSDIALSLQTSLSGFTLSEYRERDKLIPIVLRSRQLDRTDLGRLESLNVTSQVTGRSVPLKQVADVSIGFEPSKIRRRDRLQTIVVSSQLEPGYTANEIFDAMKGWLEEESAGWEIGYGWEFGGEADASATAQASVAAKLPIAGLTILLLLVAQFNSVRKPLIILLTIPLGMIGVAVGLFVGQSYFGFMTFLGVISLSGIVINNAIVLIDRIQIELDEHGRSPQDAIIEAGQRRLRPILLTTMTTVGGLIPLWIGGGAMFETMAIAILFGLLFATGLTLGVVPVLYSLLFRVSFRDYSESRAT